MTPAEFILTFVIGGIGLRGVIAWLKKQLRVKGFLALLVGFGVCAAASAIYILVAQTFNLPLATWSDFILLTCEVFAGTQAVYQATKKKK